MPLWGTTSPTSIRELRMAAGSWVFWGTTCLSPVAVPGTRYAYGSGGR